MPARYYVLDVFTDTALEGNPLAAVVDSEGLSDAAMQKIAAEFNLSETIFLEPAKEAGNRARIRIFTRTLELPFAGHPTVGAAALIAFLDGAGSEEAHFSLEETVGTLPCRAQMLSELSAAATFGLPRLPEVEPAHGSREALAAALSLEASDIGFGEHAPLEMSAGTPFTAVPLADMATLARAAPRPDVWVEAFGDGSHAAAFLYTARGEGSDAAYRSRVFAPNQGIREDPATGSAAAAFIGAMAHFEKPEDGSHRRVVEQGFEMGRPSRLVAEFTTKGGQVTQASIGGDVAIVARGELLL
ncbi:PhzF family phenazine biosynthesis protein [Afifella sp. IM 167]|uniref:PhzF family phenazine biosynthesis protein n=1 Tax=Afifella sp. IM 167 TaxID=2033586 RepID=UPI001CCA2267|nr:PhzF family phenazine biosynthesis protein [Afifella sp. IM 167]MBZ8135410.1 phenazine biosynthesis protein PhzF [Afifella sp. IM 167]